ncbi:phosphoglucomutase/phosphomannomutase family protein [Oxynema aestuarii]|jgi:phosphomannomutase|uniref:Phosphoglucomutase/phosphomannomutase family protein n=1 Tax=Oxynema aestuarii AP17 TaxID=2064643 RepID=A0A6H1U1J7_9CYAN|nr:phosphoglucomutase/phosphomannomutase family protein [Oxynema aestuarii]QIZ72748.1 phosphoglucomutase/phosphomannomutase family protein [Oxynema aestuarii AP17]RMH75749.1 MAG: phosphoglucomutase/phosphomannomutase family protein [Cyanobacteria bacterium J007]
MSAGSTSDEIKFGTDGWRGIIARDFTFANVRKVTRAIAAYLETAYSKDRPVLVGYDPRFLAEDFARTSAEVLVDLGWTVKMVDRDCPTPVIAYNARHLNSAGALMFTASHNPAPYCGIKYIPDYAGPATPEITDTIVANIASASDAPASGQHLDKISSFDPQPDYLQFLYTLLDVETLRKAKLKVKYDALYSTSRGYLDKVLEYCGCEVESFHTWRDVLFGGGMPEPKGEMLVGLVESVKKDNADLGLATDGDSDRFGIVDERGNVLTPNTILLLLARHLIKNKGKKGAIVRTVATTHLLDTLAEKYGLTLYETAVGFKYVGEKMRETEVLIGGEESGGLSIIGHIPEKDGILADMLVAEAIAYEGKPLSQLVEEAIAEAGGPLYNTRLDLHLTEAHKAAVLAEFPQNPPSEVGGIAVKEVGRKDGIKLYLEDGGWILLRPSGTEPLIRVYVETDSEEKLSKIAAEMDEAIQKFAPVTA